MLESRGPNTRLASLRDGESGNMATYHVHALVDGGKAALSNLVHPPEGAHHGVRVLGSGLHGCGPPRARGVRRVCWSCHGRGWPAGWMRPQPAATRLMGRCDHRR